MAGRWHTERGVRDVGREGALLREILGEDAAERSGTLEVVAERETPADRSARTVDWRSTDSASPARSASTRTG